MRLIQLTACSLIFLFVVNGVGLDFHQLFSDSKAPLQLVQQRSNATEIEERAINPALIVQCNALFIFVLIFIPNLI